MDFTITRQEELKARETLLLAKASRSATRAIGKPFAVRTDKFTTVRGTITNCFPKRIRHRRCSMIVQFSVTLDTGTTHIVECIPR